MRDKLKRLLGLPLKVKIALFILGLVTLLIGIAVPAVPVIITILVSIVWSLVTVIQYFWY